ncbi:hypothetical protein OAQ64_02995 [Candidatus Pelagibacter sp.]|nr:hypothetical protein [Candidatus Pelagibacter sp.]
MLNDQLKRKIEKFFSEKKYEELIVLTDKYIQYNERPPGLASLIGTCKILKKSRSKEDVLSALGYFEEAYLKGKNSIHAISGISNLISISLLNVYTHKEFLPFILKAEKYYIESEKYFEKNVEFLKAGKELFTYQLNEKKIKDISNKILEIEQQSVVTRSSCLFSNNYFYNWSQKDHHDQAKKNSKYFQVLNVKELNKISYKKNRKIHIGFVSGDFRDNHSITYFIKNTIKYIDKNKFRIFLFSFAKKNKNDQSQNELRKLADEFFDLERLNNQEAINLTQEKNVYILIDVMGFTLTNRVEIFNSRIAPVQISWLAYCNTLGFETIDYLIADKNVILPNEEKYYSEKIIKLPNIWNAHSGFDFETKYIESPSIKNKHFTFGSFNNFLKISDPVIKAWSKILKQVPNSKLILKSSSKTCNIENILNKFEKYGVQNKVKILNKLDFPNYKKHLDLYKSVDLALDTFPYNGVTTTFESLWMNVPVIVLKGFNFNSRCGESIIKNSKIDYLISSDIDDYIKKAVFLAHNKDKLENIKKELSEKISPSPLFDNKKFAKNFEQSMLDVIDKENL